MVSLPMIGLGLKYVMHKHLPFWPGLIRSPAKVGSIVPIEDLTEQCLRQDTSIDPDAWLILLSLPMTFTQACIEEIESLTYAAAELRAHRIGLLGVAVLPRRIVEARLKKYEEILEETISFNVIPDERGFLFAKLGMGRSSDVLKSPVRKTIYLDPHRTIMTVTEQPMHVPRRASHLLDTHANLINSAEEKAFCPEGWRLPDAHVAPEREAYGQRCARQAGTDHLSYQRTPRLRLVKP
ncbi:MAG: redoxin domain-containing protein [Parvularcula sp.]|jgi:alkyl hydroperoxide reductase subunit AhpC|nr:redoxin domain-containing protein [Parvularcula sp.]